MKKFLTLIFAVFSPLLLAQEAEKKPSPHSLRLLCVGEVKGMENLIIAEKSGEVWLARWRITVATQTISDVMGFATRDLCIALDPAPPKKNDNFCGPAQKIKDTLEVKPLTAFSLPDSDTAIAILTPKVTDPNAKPDASQPYRVIMLDGAKERFGDGKVLVQNFSNQIVAGVFGGKSVQINPGKTEIVQPGIDTEPEMSQITLAAKKDSKADQWEPFCDTRWPAKVAYRRYMLLLPRADGGIHPFIMPEYPPYR